MEAHRLICVALALASRVAQAAPVVVVVDPGHGGTQFGAQGDNGQAEKDVALAIAKRLKTKLERDLDATVYLTRDRDELVHLVDRVAFSNAKRPDAFISIHANSMPTRKRRTVTSGLETYFLSTAAVSDTARALVTTENADAQRPSAPSDAVEGLLDDLTRREAHADAAQLGYALHRELVRATGAPDRGVLQAPFLILMGQTAPAVLLEIGYISHPVEGKKLSQPAYQTLIAAGIARGLAKFVTNLQARDGAK